MLMLHGLKTNSSSVSKKAQRTAIQLRPRQLYGFRPPIRAMAETLNWGDLLDKIGASHPEIIDADNNLANGPTSARALLRTFSESDGAAKPRVKLYRDHAAWCPYCQRVWLMLEEKRIPYRIEKINMRCYGDKPQSFLSKNPRGLLPVVELDGQVIIESSDIMAILEREFTEHPLLPPRDSELYKKCMELMQLERKLFSDWLQWLTTGWLNDMRRASFNQTLRRVDDELQARGGPYFLGKELSMVDLMFVPFIERMVASLAYYKGFHIRGTEMFPGIEAWFTALEQRPTYMGTRSDHYTHCHDLPPQLGGCEMNNSGKAVAEEINGQNGKAWRLPLTPLSEKSIPEVYTGVENPPYDRALAAYRLVKNNAAVTRFAARGAGQEGPVPVWAPLADPTAIPNEAVIDDVDNALKCISSALINGVEEAEKDCVDDMNKIKASSSHENVKLSLQYLRDRVGVPRDLPLPAARQLRAHINWYLDQISA